MTAQDKLKQLCELHGWSDTEAKERFVAQYWGQEVGCSTEWGNTHHDLEIGSHWIRAIKYIELTSLYAPNSIWHGASIVRLGSKVIEDSCYHRMIDFVEWLFDHSEHCNHITQKEAWGEFSEYELKECELNRIEK